MVEPPDVHGYRIADKLGDGAAADVWEAEILSGVAPGGPQRVALKVLKPEAMAQPNVVAAFEYEMRVLSRLDHPGILRVLETGAQAGVVYAALELVEGKPLERHLIRHQKLRSGDVVDFGLQVLEAVDHLHVRGYVHRDIKPSNLMLTPDGRLVLMDFGTAIKSGSRIDYEVGAYGTAPYMSPEQILLRPDVDARADVYSVGILLYRMLTGRRPFRGLREDVLDAHLHVEPKPPSAVARVTPVFDDVVLRSLAKDPEDRYQSAREMWADLREITDDTSGRGPGLLGRLLPSRR